MRRCRTYQTECNGRARYRIVADTLNKSPCDEVSQGKEKILRLLLHANIGSEALKGDRATVATVTFEELEQPALELLRIV